MRNIISMLQLCKIIERRVAKRLVCLVTAVTLWFGLYLDITLTVVHEGYIVFIVASGVFDVGLCQAIIITKEK